MEKVTLNGENGDTLAFFVVETTRLAGVDYLLVTDAEQGDGECFILRDVGEEGEEAVYEAVTDDALLDYLASVFAEQLDDVDIEF